MKPAKNALAGLLLICAADAEAADVAADVQAESSSGPATASNELATIPVAGGETGDTPTERREDKQDGQRIEEVIVTSTKRATSLREIPASIAALDGADLERQGAQSMEDVIKRVPGVNLATENDITRITIRGISAANNTNATAGTLFGNVSFTDSYIPVLSLDPQPFDMKSIEVLKGPQGTLFGASALNGAIRYVPEPPKLGEFSGKYFVQYTDVSQGQTEPMVGGAVNVPAGDTAALRVVAFNRKGPGYVDNLRTDDEDANRLTQWGLRGIALWQPDEAWNISLTYATQSTSINDNGLVDNLDERLSSNNRPRESPRDTRYDLADLNIEYQFDWAQLVSESAYVNKHARAFLENTRNLLPASPVGLLGVDGGGDSDTYSQEIRLVSADDPDSRWRWIAGVFGSHQRIKEVIDLAAGDGLVPSSIDLSPLDAIIPGLGALVDRNGNVALIDLNADVTIEEIAAFGDVTRKLGKSWELSFGGRLYKTRSDGDNTQRGVVLAALNGAPEHVESGGVSETSFSPKASLVWHATPNVLSYAAVSKGFRVGGLQPGATLPTSATQAPKIFQSDTIWNYEGGVRTTWLDSSLNVDLVGFYIDWKNPQTLQYDSLTNLNYLDNVGGVRSQGFDFAMRYITPFRLMLSFSASWTDTVTTAAFQTGSGGIAESGSPWPYSPKWQTATTLSYPWSPGNWLIVPSLTHTYLGKAVNDLTYQEPILNYQQLDSGIGVQNTAIAWLPELNFTVNNVLDERGLSSRIKQGQVTDATYNQPRTFILRISGSF
jgi:iron complex outermembrane receptor protein